MLHVVLVEPEIPWNAGNIGRTCVAAGATLHLVGPLGFSLDAKQVRRSGLDYWPRLRLRLHKDLESFLRTVPSRAPLVLFSGRSRKLFWDAPIRDGAYLVFGKESTGLPAGLLRRHRSRVVRIPMRSAARSLNLSTAAGIAVYEALRRRRGKPAEVVKRAR